VADDKEYGGECYWCWWGWPKPILDIYNDCLAKLDGNKGPLHFGPAHLVWEDENWDLVQFCLDHFDEFSFDLTEHELAVVRESLARLLAVPDEYKSPPDGFDEDKNSPGDFPPPKHWGCSGRMDNRSA
jgi:hypothetical protein